MRYVFSDLSEFALLRAPIRDHLSRAAPGMEARLFVALNEAVNNALLHGHRRYQGEVTLQILEEVIDDCRCVKIVVRDEGEGFDHSPLLRRGTLPDFLDCSGRGLWIIRSLVDQMRFNERGNELTLIQPTQGPGAPESPEACGTPEGGAP